MASLKIKKGFIVGLASWLNELNLSGKESRERTRFVKVLSDEWQKIEEDRKEIISRYVAKEEDGAWKKTVDNSSGKEVEVWDLSAEDKDKVTQETVDLYNEEFVLDITEANKERMALIKEIVLNTDYKFGPKETDSFDEKLAKMRQAGDYENWSEAFESAEV